MPIDIAAMDTDIKTSQEQIKNLQHETIECVAFSASGKVTVTDKERLEARNAEIDQLKTLTQINVEVLRELVSIIGEGTTLKSVRDKKTRLENQIRETNNNLRLDIGDLVKTHFDVDPSSPFAHPEGAKLKEKADSALAIIHPLLEETTALLVKAEEIAAGFKASELPPQRAEQRPGLLSREKVSGMV